jgi:hypothetical protein
MRILVFATLSLVLLAASGAVAQGPSGIALVVEVSGQTTPAVKPFTELPAGATIALGPGARLAFVHYDTCRTVTVTGGNLIIGAKGYQAAGGAVTEARTPCPRSVKVQRGGEAAGLVLRSAPNRLILTTRPSFVLVGPRADEIASIAVAKDGETAPVLRVPLAGPRFEWPADAEPLSDNTRYDLVFSFKDPAATAAKQSIVTRTQAPDAPSPPITLIRVD